MYLIKLKRNLFESNWIYFVPSIVIIAELIYEMWLGSRVEVLIGGLAD